MPTYINGASLISGQPDANKPEPIAAGAVIRATEPDFTRHIPKNSLRRMDRISKYGLHAAREALAEAGHDTAPTGIVMGIGQTFSETPAGLLRKLITNNEGMMNPTAFMNSLLSATAGQIALQLGCDGYTNTHCQRGFSLEAALLDGMEQVDRQPEGVYIVGGVDTYNEDYSALAKSYGHISAADALSPRQIGEGAGVFAISGQRTAGTLARIDKVNTMFLTPGSQPDVRLLHQLTPPSEMAGIDLILSGRPRNGEAAAAYDQFRELWPTGVPVVDYKSFCGEYPTAAGFGLYLGTSLLAGKCQLQDPPLSNPRRILVVSSYGERYFSAIYLNQTR